MSEEVSTAAVETKPTDVVENKGEKEKEIGKDEQKWKGKGKGKGKGKEKGDKKDIGHFLTIVKDNRFYDEYYRNVGAVPAAEFDQFMAALRAPLPTTFRVTRGSYLADVILERMETTAANWDPATHSVDGVVIDAPRPIPWYPLRHAWHITAGRSEFRKCPALQELHKFAVAQNEQGNITRQEAVSMIPPLLLDVKEHHRVLDMCAAPGSKTTELVELLHADAEATRGKSAVPSGFVVANDLDIDRCFMLVHQTKRMSSPCFLVTCQNAEHYPRAAPSGADFSFDRVLCDVPCSGDGTLRKNPDLWHRWHPKMGFRQHGTQLRIAQRGAFLLRPGGRLVYSTCSMNPIEDEAVVAELIRSSNGALELVDVSAELPELKRSAGMLHWRVCLDAGKWVDTHEEIPEPRRSKVARSCFPPSPEDAAAMHLERCMRILPHQQDTGGFFIAVLKKSETATMEAIKPAVDDPAAAQPGLPVKKPKRAYGMKQEEDPLMVLSSIPGSQEAITKAKEFFAMNDQFPFHQLVTRNKDFSKILFVSSGIFDLISKLDKPVPEAPSEAMAVAAAEPPLKIVYAGLKFLQEQAQRMIVPCNYRLSMESLMWVVPYMGPDRIVQGTMADFTNLLTHDDTPIADIATAATRTAIEKLQPGCFVLSTDKPSMKFCAWRGGMSCHLLVPKEEVASLRNIFTPDHPLPPRSKQHERKHKRDRNHYGDDAAAAAAPPSPSSTPPAAKVQQKDS